MVKNLKKFITVFSLLSVIIWSSGAVALADQLIDDNDKPVKEKVTICHTTGEASGNLVDIEVALESVATHLEHGDKEGKCPPPPPPPVETFPGEWCSALVGVMSSATLRNNNVIDVNDSGSSDLTDIAIASEWYDAGNNTACLESFGPDGEFDESNYTNIDWCAGLVKGIQDSIGTQRGDTNFSEIFDVNNDGVINLSDVSFVASLLALNDQAVCYAHYVPPMPDWSEPEPEPITIQAHKIVCNNETDLPNMSGDDVVITAKTAQAIVDNSDGNCHFEADWQFQWGTNNSVLELPGDFVGKHVATGWNDFSSVSGNNASNPAEIIVNVSDLPKDNKLWFREVLQANYIPFTYPVEKTTDTASDISAEFWCDQDVLNYDNAEWINVSEGETYYCVAINVLKESEPETFPGEWCSALVGVMSSATLRNNNVIDVNDSGSSDLTDIAIASEWYDAGNNTACLESFGPDGEFDESNYTNIDWCAGLVQGLRDSIGTQRGEARFSEIFDVSNDGSINLTDVAVVASLVALGNQASCYAHYVPPMPAWEIPDTTAPVITLLGNNPVNVYVNTTYTDAGATASDNIDGDITANIVVTGTVDTTTIGVYTLTYNVSDAAGNAATPVTRTVNVINQPDGEDTTAPVITLLGNNPESTYVNTTYTDAGATASDNIDGDITANIVVAGSVDTTTIGVYTLTYNVSDAAGNAATPVTRTVNVVAQNNGGGGGGGGGGFRPQINFFNVQAQVSTSSANISWETSRTSYTWIIYGTTIAYGKEFKNNAYSATHAVILSDLLPNTLYHYQLRGFDTNSNTVYDVDRTFTTNASGIPPQVLGTKEFACVPDIDGDIKDITKFANGALLRGCGPEVYHIVDGKKFWIPNWQYLHDNYFGIRIYNISDENLVQFPNTNKDNISLKKILGGVLGLKTYANGSLLRGSDKKVYVITNGKKFHVASLEELKKYAGRKIYNVSDTILNQY